MTRIGSMGGANRCAGTFCADGIYLAGPKLHRGTVTVAAVRLGRNFVIVDTAGRLQIDVELMDELRAIRDAVNPDDSLLVIDAMTGQEAVNVADQIGAGRTFFVHMAHDLAHEETNATLPAGMTIGRP